MVFTHDQNNPIYFPESVTSQIVLNCWLEITTENYTLLKFGKFCRRSRNLQTVDIRLGRLFTYTRNDIPTELKV